MEYKMHDQRQTNTVLLDKLPIRDFFQVSGSSDIYIIINNYTDVEIDVEEDFTDKYIDPIICLCVFSGNINRGETKIFESEQEVIPLNHVELKIFK